MVKYRQRKDWASYHLTRTFPPEVAYVAQWQSWLRHSREDAPSIEELLRDEGRKERTRGLAKIADQRWITQGRQSVERLTIRNSDDAMKGITRAI